MFQDYYGSVQNEQKEEGGNVDILAKEIKSWNDFRYSLRDENALLFENMLSECGQNRDYIRAASVKGEYYSAESLFMLLVLLHRRHSIHQISDFR
jgi:hypothetical protein